MISTFFIMASETTFFIVIFYYSYKCCPSFENDSLFKSRIEFDRLICVDCWKGVAKEQ